MNEKAAAIAAQVVDIQNDRQHKGFIKVTVHVPAEHGPRLTEALGWPTYTNPVSVALACLVPEIAQRKAEALAAPVLHKPVAPDKRLAQRAGILCNDPIFRRYLTEKFDLTKCNDEDAAVVVRDFCGVESRSEIVPNTEAGNRWNLLESAYVAWREVPDFAGAAE